MDSYTTRNATGVMFIKLHQVCKNLAAWVKSLYNQLASSLLTTRRKDLSKFVVSNLSTINKYCIIQKCLIDPSNSGSLVFIGQCHWLRNPNQKFGKNSKTFKDFFTIHRLFKDIKELHANLKNFKEFKSGCNLRVFLLCRTARIKIKLVKIKLR